MTLPTVGHWKRDRCTLYIGRPSKWGNPFAVKENAYGLLVVPLDEALRRFEEHARASLMDSLQELDGQTLGCWCSPKPCHGDVLVKLFAEKFGIALPPSRSEGG